jgi:antitoxin (DNA-binding transcriptional repressor) of toxin-antitoxin stability system
MITKKEMDDIPISKFKATCLAVLARVKKTGHPIMVTRYGKALAQVFPPARLERSQSWLGCMSGKAKIVGDVISPAGDEGDWETLQS